MKSIIIEDYEKGIIINEYGNTLQVDLCYSNVEPKKKIQYVGVGILHVRASDGIRISYDYERDGYVVEQPTQLTWASDDEICDPKYKEVAFIESWALSEEQEENENKLIY